MRDANNDRAAGRFTPKIDRVASAEPIDGLRHHIEREYALVYLDGLPLQSAAHWALRRSNVRKSTRPSGLSPFDVWNRLTAPSTSSLNRLSIGTWSGRSRLCFTKRMISCSTSFPCIPRTSTRSPRAPLSAKPPTNSLTLPPDALG